MGRKNWKTKLINKLILQPIQLASWIQIPYRNIQHQLRDKIGEVAYTSAQVGNMFSEAGLPWITEGRIRNYAKKHSLTVNLAVLGVTLIGESSIQYWIPKSKLTEIINGFNIAATADDLETAALKLGYQY